MSLLQVDGRSNHPVVGCVRFVVGVVDVGIAIAFPIAAFPFRTVVVGIDDSPEIRHHTQVLKVLEVRRGVGISHRLVVRQFALASNGVIEGNHFVIVGGKLWRFHCFSPQTCGEFLSNNHIVGIAHHGVVQVLRIQITAMHTLRWSRPRELQFVWTCTISQGYTTWCHRSIIANEFFRLGTRSLPHFVVGTST